MAASSGSAGRGDRAFMATGVPNLDLVLGGGLPRGAVGMVLGPPGAGKTLLGLQIAFQRAAEGEPVLYLTGYSETHDKLLAHGRGLAFFDPALVGDRVQLGSVPDLLRQGADQAVRGVVVTARRQGARLVVLDGFRSMRRVLGPAGTEEDADAAQFLYRLGAQLALAGATLLVLVEGDPDDSGRYSELTVSDLVIGLRRDFHGTRQRRLLDVRKVRGAAPLEGLHPYALGADGFTLWPRLEGVAAGPPPPWRPERVGFGIEALDRVLGGGLTAGTTTLAAGGPGTGKTLLGLHFLAEGARRGEPSLLLSFNEGEAQLREKARVFGLDLGAGPDAAVRLLAVAGHDLEVDAIAADLRREVEGRGVRRLVLDSAAQLQRSIVDPGRAPDAFEALVAYLRARGVTAYLPYEIQKIVGPDLDLGDTPLAVLAENLLLLRHVEHRGRLRRVFSVLQMRLSDFDRAIHEVTIEAGQGVAMRPATLAAEAVLTGLPRSLPEGSGDPFGPAADA